MKISILLPFKENFSPDYPGAVSLFVYETTKNSKYLSNIKVYGMTNHKITFPITYINIQLEKNLLKSQTKSYVNKFINLEKEKSSSIIEIHNRPIYIKFIVSKLPDRIISLYFHNDPLSMDGSKTIENRK